MKSLLFALFVAVLFSACGSATSSEELPSTLDFDINNLTVQEIFELQDKRSAKELLTFLGSADATYRYLAAMAFASVQDTSDAVIAALGDATNDADETVRFAAIYALGQTNHEKATDVLLKAFRNDLETGNNRLNSTVLESVGKCAPENYLDLLVKPQKYTEKDTLLLEGQSWGVYRFAMRGITSPAGTKKMVEYVTNKEMPLSVRRIASHYLGRAKVIDLAADKEAILQVIRESKDPIIKANLAKSTRKMDDSDFGAMAVLKLQYAQASDYRVKMGIMEVLENYEYDQVAEIYYTGLKDKSPYVKLAAASYFQRKGKRTDVDRYYEIGNDSTSTDWRLKTRMLSAALTNVSYTRSALRKQINDQLMATYVNSKNPYEKGMALKGLSGFAVNYKYLIDEMLKPENHPFVKTKGLEGLIEVRRNPKLSAIFGEYYSGVAANIRKGFKDAVMSGDIGLAALGASAIREPAFRYNIYMASDYAFLKEAQAQYNTPTGMEAFYEIQQTIDYMEGRAVSDLPKPEYNHPINWGVIKDITPATTATLTTDKGDVVIKFFYKESPGTVANFIKLATDGFFDGKSFHRVIGNFVAQGGCPRGDGYGALQYSIRSELSALKYNDDGYLGMASAGKDTEGVQFFITQLPTPHLDGKYTIFAKVVEGMEVVHELQVGDKIKKVVTGNGKEDAPAK